MKRSCHNYILSCFFLIIIYRIYLNSWDYKFNNKIHDIISDLETISQVASDYNIFLYVFQEGILNSLIKSNLRSDGSVIYDMPILLAVDSKYFKGIDYNEFLTRLRTALFMTYAAYNHGSPIANEIGENCVVGFVLQRTAVVYLLILYPREDFWWYGNLQNDQKFHSKLKILNSSQNNTWRILTQEGALDKFQGTLMKINGIYRNYLYPRNIIKFIKNIKHSKFIECNHTNARIFKNRYKSETSVKARRFRHQSRKLLFKTKVVLDNLSIPFWLSSGTCLGYLRQCDIISYSQDVDIGVFVKDFNYQIIADMHAHHLYLKHWFGELEDSLELSFVDQQSTLKLDIFFFYVEGDTYWNGGTQIRFRKILSLLDFISWSKSESTLRHEDLYFGQLRSKLDYTNKTMGLEKQSFKC
ncbi:ribitol-5-phosphate transferase FKTN-like isoform X2 [Rhodnius prolixus]|uniref:ribitol-5-phosphate transferase FKTN-like isoform X2 n=1 Tax=Rhodnius prolixus TaxID=13249 RepID=UPI003D18908A